MANLNKLRNHGVESDVYLKSKVTEIKCGLSEYCCSSIDATSVEDVDELEISVHFERLHEKLTVILDKIGRDCIVVGSVAWLSDTKLMDSLSQCKAVLILVNWEDYSAWKNVKDIIKFNNAGGQPFDYTEALKNNRTVLKNCPFIKSSKSKKHIIRMVGCPKKTKTENDIRDGDLLFKDDDLLFKPPTIEYKGNFSFNKCSIMHNKYLVFLRKTELSTIGSYYWQPAYVWTGSMNFTKQSSNNLENCLFIRSNSIAQSYFDDFERLWVTSLPLKVD